MKIITHTNDGEKVYIQVKDFLYLGRLTNNKRYIDRYINLLNANKVDTEFIRLDKDDDISLVKSSDLVDFKKFYRLSEHAVARILSNMALVPGRDKSHNIEDIRSVLDFKRGVLEYSIPLFNDGCICYIDEEKVLEFSSTILNDCYAFRTKDGSDIKSHENSDFLLDCLAKTKKMYAPDMECDGRIISDSLYAFTFGKKKKKGKKKDIFRKLKEMVINKNEE